MRIRLPLGHSLFFLCAFLFALVALLPLRLALDWLALGERGLSAREAQGSVWLGRLSEARIGDAALGDLVTRLSPIQLFVGRARIDLDGGERMKGAVGVSRHSFGVDDMTAELPAGRVFAPLPIASLDLSDVSVRFEDDTCARAEGRVQARIAGDVAGVNLAQGLSGTARCEAGALLLPLASASGQERLSLKLRPNGQYEANLIVRTGDPAIVQRLTATGFGATGEGYALSVRGAL